MEKYTLNKLRDKEVINTCDGKRLGYICDAIIDICTGSVCALIVILDCRHFRFGKPEELTIPWEKVCCFGKDAVLVNLDVSCYHSFENEKKFDKK